jgi:carboxymethylenebutenolidase
MRQVDKNGWSFHLYPGRSKAGVILIHEIYGLDPYIDSVSSKLSENGYWVAAVDLFHGKHASSLDEAFKLKAALKDQEVQDALKAALELLVENMGDGAKVGSMGFCMGGGFALQGACGLNLAFCVDYYGLMENAERVKDVKGPIQLVLASEDARVTPWAFQQLLPAATKYQKRVDIHLYPNAKHAFHRPNWEGHNAEAAKDAWLKTLSFISQFK